MPDTPTQLGTAFKLGVGSFAATGYFLVEGGEITRTNNADIDEIRDMDNNVVSKLVSNKRKTLKGDFYVLNSTGTLPTTVYPGDTITLTPPEGTEVKWCVASEQAIKYTRKHTIVPLDLVKEAVMTYA